MSFLVEILNVLVNPKKVQRVLSSNRNGYFIASALGSVTPFCSCSTIPLTLGLLKAKAGFVLEKLGFQKYIKISEKEESCCPNKKTSFKVEKNSCSTFVEKNNTLKEKVFNKELLILTWKQFLSFVPYLGIGIAIGAFVHGFIPDSIIKEYASSDNIFAVPFSAFIGIPLYIRASTMVGLAPELIQSGVNLGSILALTIAGAGASLPEMIMLKKIFKMSIMRF